MMGVIIPMERLRERAEAAKDLTAQPCPDITKTNYGMIVAIVINAGPEELADFLEHELGDGAPTDFLAWLNEEAWE